MEPQARDRVLTVVIELLEEGGEDAVRLRDVAGAAHLSLRTIYELFGSRDALVLAAIERWMAEHTFAELAPPAPGETLYESLMGILRAIFEPWERSPNMLQAFYRAHSRDGSERLGLQSFTAVGPVAGAVFAGADRGYAEDVVLILTNVAWAVVSRVVRGELPVTDILPALERTVFRLTADNAPAARATVERRDRSRSWSRAARTPPSPA